MEKQVNSMSVHQEPQGVPRSGVAREFRVLGYWTLALFLLMVALGVGGALIRDHDVDARIKDNNELIDEQRRTNQRQRRTIRYLCQSTVLQDVTVVQQAGFLRIILKNKKFGEFIGPNEREALNSRAATLEAIHDELSSQRAQRACKGF